MNRYELTLENFQGPLDKLLELIEEKKLGISEFSLAEVTNDFLEYLDQFKRVLEEGTAADEDAPQFDVPPELLADFLVVASRLLLIKSKSLLPSLALSEEEESEIKDLEHRLKVYQEFKKTQDHVRASWSEMPKIYTREFFSATEPLFYPPAGVTPDTLLAAAVKITGELEQLFKPKATVKNQIIHLRAKIEEIASRISTAPMKFKELREGKSKGELVVLFLAVLHLIKQQLVRVEQEGHFADITIAKKESGEYNDSTKTS